MAVEWRHLIFGDADSADYGIYISGDGVYNAPERAVEFVDVPGRNGAIALDQGRYNNITVTYPAGVFATTQEEFQEKISAFRNAILSQRGYQRLEDTYHPDEYRMGIYLSGLEVSPVNYNHAGEFELTFNCKPQRWLTVGEYPIPVNLGDVLQNPTLFESRPLLEIDGDGALDVRINNYDISLPDELMGEVSLIRPFSLSGTSDIRKTFTLDTNLFENGDTVTVPSITFRTVLEFDNIITSFSASVLSSEGISGVRYDGSNSKNNYFYFNVVFPEFTLAINRNAAFYHPCYYAFDVQCTTNGTNKHAVVSAGYIFNKRDSGYDTPVTLEFYLSYDTEEESIISHQIGFQLPKDVTADSTMSVIGHPTYIDCDVGEVYKYVGDTVIILNSRVPLGDDLPVLVPGSNKVYKTNAVTRFNIIPRWWKI